MARYLTLNDYDGSLGGFQEYIPNPSDVYSDIGSAVLQHHRVYSPDGGGYRSLGVFTGTEDHYTSGEYKNMYKRGHSSMRGYTGGSTTQQTKSSAQRDRPYFWETKKNNVESYSDMETDLELIAAPGITEIPGISPLPPLASLSSQNVSTNMEEYTSSESFSPALILFMLVVLFIVFEAWTKTAQKFIVQKFNEGKDLSWQQYGIYAAIATIVLVTFAYIFKVPYKSVNL